MNCFSKLLRAGALGLGALGAGPALAATHAMVIGINDYQFFPPYDENNPSDGVYDLLGAVNDANLIAFSLQKAGVNLPEDRILINERATVSSFLAAWEDMKAGAAPGDTLLITFAGHGAQETEAIAPFDEADGRDEIIMFHEFDPANPGIGRLSDDELFTLMADAQDYNIVWVMDSCHAGGLVRSAAATISRFGGLFDGLPEPSLSSVPVKAGSDAEAMAMPHVTQILATESEFLRVNETRIEGEMHGALSWHFAEAISGEADRDMDRALSRTELRDFLTQRVFSRMNQSQQPSILPEGADAVLVRLGGAETAPAAPVAQAPREETLISVNFEGGRPPGLDTERIRRVRTGAELTFRAVTDSKWEVYNHTGDRITSIETVPDARALAEGWPQSAAPLLDRAEVLNALANLVTQSGGDGALTAAHGGALLRLGEDVSFTFRTPSGDLRYLTMFNIASNGAVQPLHPVEGDGALTGDSMTLTFEVMPPLGADQLVAIACPAPPLAYQARLKGASGQTATAALFQDPALAECSVSSLGVFTQ